MYKKLYTTDLQNEMSKMRGTANTSRLPVDAHGGDELALVVVDKDQPVGQGGSSGSASARRKRAEPAGRQQRIVETEIIDGTVIGLPSGWICERRPRTCEQYLGRFDQFYYDRETGVHFRSFKSTIRYLGIEEKDLPLPPRQMFQALKARSMEGRGCSSLVQLTPSCKRRRSVHVAGHSRDVRPPLPFKLTEQVRRQSSEVQPPPGIEFHSTDCGRISVKVPQPPGLKPNTSQESSRSTEEQLPPYPMMLLRRSCLLQLPRGFKSRYNGGRISITVPRPPGLEPNSTQEPKGSTEVQQLPAFNLPLMVSRGQSSEVQPPSAFKLSSTTVHGQYSSQMQTPTGFSIPSTMERGQSSTEEARKKTTYSAEYDFIAAPEEITWVLIDAKRDIWIPAVGDTMVPEIEKAIWAQTFVSMGKGKREAV